MAQNLGLNRATSSSEGPSDRTFWVLYHMEKTSCFLTGRVPILQDAYISCPLPDTSAWAFSDYDWFFSFVRYARLVSRIQSQLLSITSVTHPEATCYSTVKSLHAELGNWRSSIPVRFRPGEPIRPRQLPEPRAIAIALRTHYYYHYASLTLTWSLVHSGNNGLDTNEQLEVKTELMQTARSVLELTSFIEISPSTPVWIVALAPISALMILFDLVIHNPNHPETTLNLALLDIASGHFSRIEYSSNGTLPGRLISEFAHLARQYISDMRHVAGRQHGQAGAGNVTSSFPQSSAPRISISQPAGDALATTARSEVELPSNTPLPQGASVLSSCEEQGVSAAELANAYADMASFSAAPDPIFFPQMDDILALIEVLSDPANRAPLEAERALAEIWYSRSQGDNEADMNHRPSVPDAPQPPFIVPGGKHWWQWEEQVQAAQLRPELPWHYDALSKFPFITTCLLLGLLRNDYDGDANITNQNSVRPGDVQLQPLSTIFRADCTEYGLVVLDISDLNSGVKYGILAFPVCYMADVWCHNPYDWDPIEDRPPDKEPDTILASPRHRVPLSIVQWLRKNFEFDFYRENDPNVLRLEEKPLVDHRALNYFWPPKPGTRAKSAFPPGPGWTISDEPPGKEHRDLDEYVSYAFPPGPGWTIADGPPGKEHSDRAIDNLLILTQDPANLHLDQNTILNFQKLAEFRDHVRRRIEEVPDNLGPSEVSGHILRVAYAGHMHLNWVAFRNLSPSVIAAAIESDELRSASALSLCIDNFKLEGNEGGFDDLAATLSQSTGLKQLCFLQRPDRDSDNASARFWRELQQRWRSSGDFGWLRDKTIYLTCAFSASLCSSKLSSPLTTDVRLTSPVVQVFPVVHIFTFVDNADYCFQKHLNSSNLSYYEDMSNTLLTAERFTIRFLLYLLSLGLGSDKAIFRFAYEGAFSPPTTTTITTDDDDNSLPQSSLSGRFAVSPIPAGHFAPPPEVNYRSRIRVRDIQPGSWVVLVDQPSHNLIDDDDDALIRYAFVRIGQTSTEIVPEQQQ
ncbi:hypothetical protein N8T08_003398 [Aspergillus melleus]|uniref:Uncharacterized protein n=1 Tax=Aspergillus melleus TaxID=138277 RepID=A0ACC3BGE2_9EURO|nr:hypothetical protein N8T08_003398 [Aspergillus melleus]